MSTKSDSSELHSYVVSVDTGFAPNVTNGVCTLATCKQVIREEAKEGDWVLGTNPKEAGEERITYFMEVGEKLTYDQYYNCGRFDFKKPENDPIGDNIYYRNKKGDLVQVENPPAHDNDECREKDLKSNSVLVADRFWYFGDQGPELPANLREKVIKGYKSSSRPGRKKPTKYLDDLLQWITDEYDPGIYGEPRNGFTSSCTCESDTSNDEIC
ncbi:hypothetical protein RBH26_21155 [Natronolimnohabitans sp. A-GB9]|uniref:Nmad2 family putative nucleotide modification protein n=1 Tax=Natronolimnohabitans sp. A-GB9 TaxID=3069757 RepID=UPI0027AF726F|nr:hypothetical protein [Natronolimnohabitans sp. A-GB9]MDQ2052954.1 hypothetical protein [Natronolimnohabitans sp. A-GB9]